MKPNQLMAVFALSIVLTGVGISKSAVAESNINPIQVVARRICAPAPFGEIRRTDFKGINLNRIQLQKIRQAYETFLGNVIKNSGRNKCYNEDEGTISKNFLGFYTRYEVAVREILTPRQSRQWDKNLDSILGRGQNN